MKTKNVLVTLILTAIMSLQSSVFANCDVCNVRITGGTNGATVNANQTLCIESGVLSGNINLNGDNITICIAEGATFNPSNFTTRNGLRIINKGTYNISGLNADGNTIIDNYGTINVNGNTNINSSLTINNNVSGFIVYNVHFAINNNGLVVNNGAMILKSGFDLGEKSEFINNGRCEVKSNIAITGKFTNNGFFVADKVINFNNNSQATNNCTLYSLEGFNHSSSKVFNNNGLIRAEGLVQLNGSSAFNQSENGYLVGINFINNGSVTGKGNYYFTGDTKNNGKNRFGEDGKGIIFYDESSNGKCVFDDCQAPHSSVKVIKIAKEDTSMISAGCSDYFPAPVATDVVYYAELNQSVFVPIEEIAWDSVVGLDIVSTNLLPASVTKATNGRTADYVFVDEGKGTYYFYAEEGLVEFRPKQDYTGVSSIDYYVKNKLGYKSNMATVTIIIEPSPLPVELVYFEGKLNDGEVDLSWLTASEKNNDYFQIERSADGINFEPIGTVAGHGNSVSPIQYAFVDAQPLAGLSYYRLLQVDYDGQSEYSKVISIENAVKVDFALNVFPVPTSDEITVQSTENIQSLRVMDTKGSIVKAQKLNANQVKLSLADLTPGMYLVQVDYTNGANKTAQVLKR